MILSLRAAFRCLLLGAFLFVGAHGASGQSYDLPPRPDGPVLDQAQLLTSGERARLAGKLTAYTDTTSTAIVVVTVPTLNGAPISDYAFALGREWGVGQAGADNGVVVLVSSGDRKVFIATGYGLEGAIPDVTANRIIDRVMTPAFRRGAFYAGLDRATTELMRAAAGEFTVADRAPEPDTGVPIDPALVFMGLIFLYFVVKAMRSGGGGGGRHRRRHGVGGPVIIWGGGSSGGGFDGGGGFGGFGGGDFGGGGAGGDW